MTIINRKIKQGCKEALLTKHDAWEKEPLYLLELLWNTVLL